MPSARSPLALALAVTALVVTALASGVTAQEANATEGEALPVPGRDVPVFDVEGTVGSGPRTVLTWAPVDGAASYEVYVNADQEDRPTWVRVDGRMDDAGENVTFVDESPPEPAEGRTEISYAVLAVDEAGEPVAEGRVAVEPEGAVIPYRGPFNGSGTDAEQEAAAATTTGTLIGIIALAVVAIAVLAFIGLKRRGD